ncbi:MAG TPA: class I SAM-dependent methyltransferase [Streptosporangiaceae bacterium]|nr:class I SAM-dependent methyltransferase [Streptosporangiaceae bacterium]
MASADYQRIRDDLRLAYDGAADERDRRAWWRGAGNKGLHARVRDYSQLDLAAESFDAVYAMNCLLHVPNADLPTVLSSIAGVLQPGGLFFLGVYGGGSKGPREGPATWDDHVPARFFSWRTDDQITQFVSESFDIIDFHVAQADTDDRFQSLTLQRPAGAG